MKNQFANMKQFQPQKRLDQDIPAAAPDADAAPSPSVANLKPTGSGLRPPLTNGQKQQPVVQGNIYQAPGNASSFGQMQQSPEIGNASNGQGFFPGRLPTTPGSQSMPGGAPAGPSQSSSSFAGHNPSGFAPAGPRPSGYLPNNSMPGISGPPSFAGHNPSGFAPAGPRPSGYPPNNPMPGPSGPPPFAGPNAPGFAPAGPRPSGYPPNNPMPRAANSWQAPGYPQTVNPGRMPGEMTYQQRGAPNFGPPPMRPTAPGKDRRKKRRFPIWARVLVAALAVLLILVGGVYGYYQLNYADAVNSITGQQAIHHATITGSTPLATTSSGGTPNGNRVNILLLGSDDDGKGGNNGVGGSPLAQTDLVITIDPQTNYIGELSIPRDLQVTIPNHGAGKMDFAFSYGYQDERSNNKNLNTASAAALAEDTITYNYGIHIDYYAWVGLNGFVKVIDTAGGVDIDILHPIVDDTYPDDVNNPNGQNIDYTRLYITPGPQHLNGVQALNYVRTRHADLGADFARTIKQQQLLSQLKTKLATPDTIGKAPALLADLKGFLQTDMTPAQIINMANYARGTDTNKIEHITLSPPTYSASGLSGGNFAPICSQVKVAVAKMFAVQPRCIPQGSLASTTSSYTPALAMTTPALQPQSGATFARSSWSSLNQAALSNTTNWNMASDFTGVHSLLDLMFMAVFGSFDAAKV